MSARPPHLLLSAITTSGRSCVGLWRSNVNLEEEENDIVYALKIFLSSFPAQILV